MSKIDSNIQKIFIVSFSYILLWKYMFKSYDMIFALFCSFYYYCLLHFQIDAIVVFYLYD